MEIRVLVPADASSFHALRLRGLREDPTAFASSHEEECDDSVDLVASRLAPRRDGAIFGAFSGPTLAGVVGVQRAKMRKLSHKVEIWGMYVAPEHRRGGVARRLVEAALAHASAMGGVRQANLGVNAANDAAIALYRALGFEQFGLERGYMIVDGVFQDEIHMARLLPSSPAGPG